MENKKDKGIATLELLIAFALAVTLLVGATLVSFGGAGGLHVCALAEALDMREALVPVHAGVLSALGMLVAPRSRQLSQTINQPLRECDAQRLESSYAPLIDQGQRELLAEGVVADSLQVVRSVDVRYRGQSYYLNVAWQDVEQTARAFHALHEQRYGHSLDNPLEVVNVRVALFSEADKPMLRPADTSQASTAQTISLYGIDIPAQLWQRERIRKGETLAGPALITETISTTYLAPGWQATQDQFGNLLLTRRGQG